MKNRVIHLLYAGAYGVVAGDIAGAGCAGGGGGGGGGGDEVGERMATSLLFRTRNPALLKSLKHNPVNGV